MLQVFAVEFQVPPCSAQRSAVFPERFEFVCPISFSGITPVGSVFSYPEGKGGVRTLFGFVAPGVCGTLSVGKDVEQLAPDADITQPWAV
jgi:hypothetical protein